MKKVFTVLSLAALFAACNNGAEKKAEVDTATHAAVDTATHAADTAHAAADTTKKADTSKAGEHK